MMPLRVSSPCGPCLLYMYLQDSDAGVSGSDADGSDGDSELAYEMEMEDALEHSYKEYLERRVNKGEYQQGR
jgi:hypothetical protein